MITNIFDSHAHYHDEAFKEDCDSLLSSFPSKGIEHIVDVATDLESMEEALKLSEKYQFISVALGVHPSYALEVDITKALDAIRNLSKNEKVVSIGEIGLDYHYDIPKEPQIELFKAQMSLAEELHLPVIIHSREATEATLSVLRQFENVKGVVHCFSGSAQTAEQLLKMGYYIGFTGIITFSNAKKAIHALSVVPLSRLLVETDCPYLAPTPFRGKRCDSTMLTETLQKMAEVKGVPIQEMANITNENARRLFGIKE